MTGKADMSKISVIMPVYNTNEEYLKEAIESILNQTYSDFEFIIINDGSDNDVEKVILSYTDKRIKYIKNEENLGLIKTLNKGLAISSSEYIARMDSDDISLPTRFEQQIDFLDKNNEVDVLGTWFKMLPQNEIIKRPTSSQDIKNFLLFINCPIAHPTVMMKKSFIEKNNYRYNENDKHAEDYGLWLSMMDKTEFAIIPEVLLDYRWHENNISIVQSEVQISTTTRLMTEYQTKFFGDEFKEDAKVYLKVRNKEKITSNEFKLFISYLNKIIKETAKGEYKCLYLTEYFNLYKNAAKNSERDFTFLKTLWTNSLNQLAKNGLYFKLVNSIRGWN